MEAYLIWGSEAQSLSGAVIEALGGVIQFLPGDGAQVPVLGEVLADQPIGIFVRTPLPGVVGMGKVDSGVQELGDPFVFGSLRAVVQRERMHPVPERAEEVHSRLSEGGGGPPRQRREQGIARVPPGRRGPHGDDARSGCRLPSPRSGCDVPRGPGGHRCRPCLSGVPAAPAGQTAPLGLLGPIASPPLVAANLP